MRNKVTTASTVRRLLENARYEILPTASIEATVLEHVPVGHTVTVTASPKKGIDPTLELAARLTTAGYTAVPHLAARMISGKADLAPGVEPMRPGKWWVALICLVVAIAITRWIIGGAPPFGT